MSTTQPRAATDPGRAAAGIDPRGPQFNAAVTAVVLVAVLLTLPGPVATVLLAVQAVLFATGAVLGVQRSPLAAVFRGVVRPRLSAPDHLEDPAPPRFAQAVGLGFALVGLVGLVTGLDPLAYAAIAAALVAALLNAVFRFCLGCEVYLLLKRATA